MNTDFIIPTTYPEWRYCIEQRCRQPLTPDYIAARLAALRDPADTHSREFSRIHGPAHLLSVTRWFEQAFAELPSA